MPRPSGTRQTPERARRSAGWPVTSSPNTSRRPLVGFTWPARDLEHGGLPCTVRAEQRVHLSRHHCQIDAFEHVDGAVARAHTFEREHRPGGRAPGRGVGRLGRHTVRVHRWAFGVDVDRRRHLGRILGFVRCPEVRRTNGRVRLDRLGLTGGDEPAEVEHVDVRARPHHEAHVVLDEQDPEPRRREILEQGAELGRLALVEPRRRLVEQQHARLARQRARPPRAARCRWAAGRRARRQRLGVPMRSMISSTLSPSSDFSRDHAARISDATSTFSRTESVPKVSRRWNVRPMPSRARRWGFNP